MRDSSSEARLAPVSYLPGAGAGSVSSERNRSAGSGSRSPSDDSGAVVLSLAFSGSGAESDDGNAPEVVEQAVVEQRVLRALSRKALSESEVRALITENGLEGEEAETLVARLIDLRYVDDRVLAEELRRRLSEVKGQSKAAVARALSARGLESDIVAETVAEIDADDERAAARNLAEKRARQLGSLDAQTVERRLSGFLARRGYPGGLVREVVSEVVRKRSAPSGGPRFR
ncbi:regulatory protein RecX [Labedella populi]|uniref:regulatory protein RecX n=1 Tax=Labedella populi TaxID=2498850 RepID=UPI00140ADB7B|nr:regulatory protein RecX [Labedella populi]